MKKDIFCINKNKKCIGVFSFDATLKPPWKKYSENKLFDNIIGITNSSSIFYVSNGNNIIKNFYMVIVIHIVE